jgi:6-phosphofructokinase
MKMTHSEEDEKSERFGLKFPRQAATAKERADNLRKAERLQKTKHRERQRVAMNAKRQLARDRAASAELAIIQGLEDEMDEILRQEELRVELLRRVAKAKAKSKRKRVKA